MSVPMQYNDHLDAVTGLRNSASESVHEVRWQDLPLACPRPTTSLWNGHPRIYLPLPQSGRVRCPYCGTLYILRDPEPDEPEPHFTNQQIEQLYRQAVRQSERVAET